MTTVVCAVRVCSRVDITSHIGGTCAAGQVLEVLTRRGRITKAQSNTVLALGSFPLYCDLDVPVIILETVNAFIQGMIFYSNMVTYFLQNKLLNHNLVVSL